MCDNKEVYCNVVVKLSRNIMVHVLLIDSLFICNIVVKVFSYFDHCTASIFKVKKWLIIKIQYFGLNLVLRDFFITEIGFYKI